MRSSRHRRRRSHKLLAAAITVLVLTGIGGGSELAYVSLRARVDQLQSNLTTDLQGGQRELEAGRASLAQANSKRDASLVADALLHFENARVSFLAAGQLADSSALLRDLEQLPAVGDIAHSRHAAVDGVAGMGVAISDAGRDLSELDRQLLGPPANGQAARTLLTVLDQAHSSLTKVRLDLQRAQTSAALVNVGVLPEKQQGTFVKTRDTISSALSGLDEFERLVPVLTEVLGGNGVRTYLVEQVNPAELRAGGGFIGTYSLLQADHGTFSVIRSGDSYDLAQPRPQPWQPGFIPQPGPLREIIPTVSWSFVDSNLYPDFPSNAAAAENFVQPRLGMKIDGVVSMDYYTVAKMLELTGPLAVPGYGFTVDASTFVAQVFALDITGAQAHKAILFALAGPLMARISTLPPERWPALVAAFNGLTADRHLQTYFNNAAAEAEIDRVGWSGGPIVRPTREYMMEVEANYGSKANYFLTRQYSVVLTRTGGTLHHRVAITLINSQPYGSYDRTYYHADVRLYVGGNASSLSDNLSPLRFENPAPPSGTELADGWVLVQCCGSQDQAVFEYDTPWPVHNRGIDEIYWQKQPGTLSDSINVIWNDGLGHSYSAKGDLSQDRLITLTPTGVTLTIGRPAEATLPSLSLG